MLATLVGKKDGGLEKRVAKMPKIHGQTSKSGKNHRNQGFGA